VQHFFAQGDFSVSARRDLHQATGNIDRITYGRDVLMAFAAKSRCYDCPVVRSNLEAEPGCS
jgi:hypothetical protein